MDWKKVENEMPEYSHVKKRTQFLIKGFYQVGDSVGCITYDVSRLCNYFNDKTILFETRSRFTVLEWVEIT